MRAAKEKEGKAGKGKNLANHESGKGNWRKRSTGEASEQKGSYFSISSRFFCPLVSDTPSPSQSLSYLHIYLTLPEQKTKAETGSRLVKMINDSAPESEVINKRKC